MSRRENFWPLIGTATGLTLAILVTFQIYQFREPSRLRADAQGDLREAVEAGTDLYQSNCASCHGASGEGIDAPALNSKALLSSVSDDQFTSLIRTGVPGTGMPAWGQKFGGPLTDENIRHIIAYVRSWEPVEAPAGEAARAPDPARGAEIFEATCFACHGVQGVGSERAPALNDPDLLNRFDDDWFRDTIVSGRPSKGMPTWGTVLAPSDIDDVVALIALWRQGASVPVPAAGPSGEALYAANCAACHGASGEGGIGPALDLNDFVTETEAQDLADFILAGRAGTAMIGFNGRLSADEMASLVELLKSWQP